MPFDTRLIYFSIKTSNMDKKISIKLDEIDQKILSVLIKNARISTIELAKVVKNYYPTVRSHLGKLIDNGVITNFHPILQFPGIGIRRYMGVYLSLKNISTEEQLLLIKEFKKSPFLIHVYELEGTWNVFLLLVTNYIKEARDTLDFVKQKCGEHLSSFIIMPTFTVSPLNRKFFLSKEDTINQEKIKSGYNPLIQKIPLIHLEKHVDLDETDIKILNEIRLNGKASLEDIADKVKIEPAKVDYRIKRYIKTNLIKYFSIDVDPELIGYTQYSLFLNLQGNTKAKEEIANYLKKIPQAYHYIEYIGYWEMVITFCVKKREELNDIKNDIIKNFKDSIKDDEVVWIKKRHKFEPYPLVDFVYPKK
jgi:DNA-binding Lrp family transcriptional regulator